MQTLLQIGKPAVTAIRAALQHKELYVRLHARLLLQRVSVPADKAAFVDEVSGGLQAENPLDRASTCELLAAIGAINTVVRIRELLADCDPDVVRAAALALAKLGDRASAPFIETALLAANFIELRIDLAFALCQVGGTKGALVLLANLDYPDDLIRATCFENFYAVTGQHQGYDPSASSEERLAAIARLQAFWARNGGPDLLHRSFLVDPATSDQAFIQVMAMGGGAGIIPAAEDDETVITALAAHGSDALPALIKGLKFPRLCRQARLRADRIAAHRRPASGPVCRCRATRSGVWRSSLRRRRVGNLRRSRMPAGTAALRRSSAFRSGGKATASFDPKR